MMSRRKVTKPKRTRLNIVDIVLIVLNSLTAVALLLSYQAPDTSPRNSVLIAILGLGYYFIAGAALLFVAYWLIRRKFAFILISAIAILMGIPTITKFIGFRTSSPIAKVKSNDCLRLLDYNLREFTGVGLYDKENTKDNIFKVVSNYQPDLVTMQEFASEDSVTIIDFKKSLNYKYSFAVTYKQSRHDKFYNVIFSRYPIIKADTVPAPKLLDQQAIYADINYGGKIIRIYCVHLAAVNAEGSVKSRILKGNGDAASGSLIWSRVSYAFLQRSFQVERIKRHMETCTYPILLAGDFNDTPISYAVNELGDGLQNASFEKGSGFVTTYNARFPLQIDYILAGQAFDITGFSVPNEEISDHKPVIADLKLKP